MEDGLTIGAGFVFSIELEVAGFRLLVEVVCAVVVVVGIGNTVTWLFLTKTRNTVSTPANTISALIFIKLFIIEMSERSDRLA